MCSPRKSNKNFSIFTFYESKQMPLTQDLRWSLGRSIALQLQRQTDLLLCTINCFLQWDHLPNMAVGGSSLLLYSISMVTPWEHQALKKENPVLRAWPNQIFHLGRILFFFSLLKSCKISCFWPKSNRIWLKILKNTCEYFFNFFSPKDVRFFWDFCVF